ncbi:hypothetical protein FRB94_002184 [Tulasnella sp. JGI-2019a]|nr:hypothetical protein FRB94_002184 [Tulasnella sp. JGI-2019a]KAG9029515.1 hypothetical protein FRB95_005236 [Tulasnella sp. JGI-2019a]
MLGSTSPSSTSKDGDLTSEEDSWSMTEGTDRAPSPTPSMASMTPSLYSYKSSVDGRTMLRDMEGRTLQATSDGYMLPADDVEHGRLDLQHNLLKLKIGGLYFKPEAVRRALAPKQDITPTVLDIGTGSGSWAIDMGRLFPHVEITGLDLAPANLTSTPPPNCHFECDDANLGLSHYQNAFNLVHCRLLGLGIKDYRSLLNDIAGMLRPGGVYLSIEVDLRVCDGNCDPIFAEKEEEKGFTWLQKTMSAAHAAFKERAPGGCDAGHDIPKWLKSMDCWEETGEKKMYIPVGAWDEGMNKKQRTMADMMLEDTRGLVQALRPLLISHGFFEETVNRMLSNTDDELAHVRKKQHWRFLCAWGIKKGDPSGTSDGGHPPGWAL